MRFAGYVGFFLLLAGCGSMGESPKPIGKAAKFEMLAATSKKTHGAKEETDPSTKLPLFLISPTLITAADVETVRRTNDHSGMPALAMQLTPAGGKKLAAATSKPMDQLAIVIDGVVVAAPKVRATIEREFIVGGIGSQKRCDELIQSLTKN